MGEIIAAVVITVVIGWLIHDMIANHTEQTKFNNAKHVEFRRFVSFVDQTVSGAIPDESPEIESIKRGLNTLDRNLVEIDQGRPAPYNRYDSGER